MALANAGYGQQGPDNFIGPFTEALDKVLGRCEALRSGAETAMKTGDDYQSGAAGMKQRIIASQQAHQQNMSQLRGQLEEARQEALNAQAEAKESESKAMFAKLDREKAVDWLNKLIADAQALGVEIPPRRSFRSYQPQSPIPPLDEMLELQGPTQGGSRSSALVAGSPRQAPRQSGLSTNSGSAQFSPRSQPFGEAAAVGSDDDLFGSHGLGAGSRGLTSARSQETGSSGRGNNAVALLGGPAQGGGNGFFGGGGGGIFGDAFDLEDEDDDEFAGLGFGLG